MLARFGDRNRVGEVRGDQIVASGPSARRAEVASERASLLTERFERQRYDKICGQ
jgi:hypothetical protein